MLHFFRKYQTYFFAVITFVIIISFSFFGTYNAMSLDNIKEKIAFTAVDGSPIKQSELDAMVAFISTDSQDKLYFGGAWGPNFFNDGVLKKDIISTGLAEILVSNYPELVSPDLKIRLDKEKRFIPYVHPNAKFLSAEGAWNYLAPEIKTNFDSLRRANDSDLNAFSTRVRLFLAEKKLPAPLLQQVLRYQEQQYGWLTPDPNLAYSDLSLFGYHTTEDWFGQRFIRLAAEFIINSSKIAEQKGYQISKAEALADLSRNSAISFKENAKSPQLGVANNSDYFNEQLRRLGMDQSQAIKIWQQVLLFRSLFHDVGNAVVTDNMTESKFHAYANESIQGDFYRLPKELRLANFKSLQKFEVYLNTVSKREKNSPLNLPTNFLPAEDLAKRSPELVQKRYLLSMAAVNKNTLQAKVGIKEMWNWEVTDKNWTLLKERFPELGSKAAETRNQRFTALEQLDDRTRARLDAFARAALVDEHPEWIEKALAEAELKPVVVGITLKGGNSPFVGFSNRADLIEMLDQAPLTAPSPQLASFSGDKSVYYRVIVLERLPNLEILSFEEANKAGVLDKLLDQELETYYLVVRKNNPTAFQNADKSWKEFSDVHEVISSQYFENLLNAIRKEYAAIAPEKSSENISEDTLATFRFYPYVKKIEEQLQNNNQEGLKFVRPATAPDASETSLTALGNLADQWKLEQLEIVTQRSDDHENEFFNLSPDEWSRVYTPATGDLNFFHLIAKKNNSSNTAISVNQDGVHKMLSDDAQRNYMHQVVGELKQHNAISFEYMNRDAEIIEPEHAQ